MNSLLQPFGSMACLPLPDLPCRFEHRWRGGGWWLASYVRCGEGKAKVRLIRTYLTVCLFWWPCVALPGCGRDRGQGLLCLLSLFGGAELRGSVVSFLAWYG